MQNVINVYTKTTFKGRTGNSIESDEEEAKDNTEKT